MAKKRNDKVKNQIIENIEKNKVIVEQQESRFKDIGDSINILKHQIELDEKMNVIKFKKMVKVNPIWEYETDEKYQALFLDNQKDVAKQQELKDKIELENLDKALEATATKIEVSRQHIAGYEKRLEEYK